jgi:hypothetical protein
MQIISGGQTGVDRAALDAAIELGIELGIDLGIDHGGWVPLGRIAEDGVIASQYQMQETPSFDLAQRTEWNVRDADATLIISRGELTGGSALTQQIANQYNRPSLHIDLVSLSIPDATSLLQRWLSGFACKTLNVAGPRASKDPEIYLLAKLLLQQTLLLLIDSSKKG